MWCCVLLEWNGPRMNSTASKQASRHMHNICVCVSYGWRLAIYVIIMRLCVCLHTFTFGGLLCASNCGTQIGGHKFCLWLRLLLGVGWHWKWWWWWYWCSGWRFADGTTVSNCIGFWLTIVILSTLLRTPHTHMTKQAYTAH